MRQGTKHSLETRLKISKNHGQKKSFSDLKSPAIHKRIRVKYGKANHCDNLECEKKSISFDWSNKSGKYLEDMSDWWQLCRKCHIIYDMKMNPLSMTQRMKGFKLGWVMPKNKTYRKHLKEAWVIRKQKLIDSQGGRERL